MKKAYVLLFTALLAIGIAGCLRMEIVKNRYQKAPSLPTLEGTLKVAGLNGPVEIDRDAYGVPHIMTEDEHDLFFAIGYTQAQDRLWEMVFLRALSEGRVSELMGDVGVPGQHMMGFPLSTTGIDKTQRIMGMKWLGEVGEALLKQEDPAIYSQLEAYCDGVNAFIGTHQKWEQLPIEFQVLKVRPAPFRIADMMSLNVFIGSMLAGNMDVELMRYGFFKKYGEDLGWKLMPLHYSQGPTIVPPELLKNKLAHPRDLPPGGRPSAAELGYDFDKLSADAALKLLAAESSLKKLLYVDYPLASNNWIVGPKITESGHAMVANDPHLEHIEPSLMYLMHVKGAGFDTYGACFPGMPYVVLGHTRTLGWGETTSIADVQDLYIETTDQAHPGMYKYKGEWRPFTVRKEIIKVRMDGRLVDRELKVRQSIHGPIINEMADLPKDAPPIALRWVAWDFTRDVKLFEQLVQSTTVDDFMARIKEHGLTHLPLMSGAHAFNAIGKGESIEDFKRGMDKLVLPNQNWVAADSAGHIIYLPGGLVPIRNKGIGVMPVPGESGEFDWTGFIPLLELPWVQDPARGYMATANNEVVDAEWYPYVFETNYGDGYRAWRIEELINQLKPLSMDDMKRIQNDVHLKRADWEVPFIAAAMAKKKPTDLKVLAAHDVLKNWDHEASLDATAPVLFFTFTKMLRRNTLADEVKGDDYGKFLGSGELDMVIGLWMDQGGSPFFDDQRTRDKVEDMDDMIVKSLGDAMAEVEKKYGKDQANWKWGKLHYIKWYHPFGWGPLADMSVGPFPHIGANGTVRNAGSAGFGKDPWKCLGGPVLRHIMDMQDPDNAQIVIDGSESGQWLSPHYRDMHPLWLNSQYLTAVMDPAKVRQQAKYHLTLEP
jgi:penicillin amidase